jgi:hypothetical protein
LIPPVITGAQVAPGHDGQAELVVLLRHDNGARDRLTLDADAAERLLARCGVDDISALAGQDWRHLMHVLEESDQGS